MLHWYCFCHSWDHFLFQYIFMMMCLKVLRSVTRDRIPALPPCFHSIVWATAPAAPQLCMPNQKSRGTDRHTMGRLQQSGLEFDLENPIDRYKYLAKYRNILSR